MPRSLQWTLYFSIGMYALSILVSTAGMEIFSSLLILSVLVCWIWQKTKNQSIMEFFRLGPDIPLLVLFVVVLIGAFVKVNPEADTVFVLGKMRWLPVLYCTAFAMNAFPFTKKYLPHLISVGAVIAFYGLIQHFTGLDILRDSNRAVQPMGDRWRTAGLYGSPMTYAYLFGQLACFPLAAAVVFFQCRERRKALILLIAFALIGVSLVTSMVRGVWLASMVGILIMGAVINRKALVAAVVAVSVAFAGVFVSPLGSRLASIFDSKTRSSSERVILWRANWEMFKEHPIIGVGYGENEQLVGVYFDKMGMPETQFRGHPHNTFVQFLSGTGAIGFICFLMFMVYFILLSLKLWRRLPEEKFWERSFALGSFGALIVLNVGGLTECAFEDLETRHAAIFIMASVAAIAHKNLPRPLNLKSVFT